MYTESITIKIDNVLTNATSVKLSDEDGLFGIKDSDGTVVVADDTATTNSSTGVYEYDVSALDVDETYTISWEIVYGGVTQYEEYTFTLNTIEIETTPITYNYYTLEDAIDGVRRILNDDEENVWTNADITAYINSGILLIKSKIPEYFTELREVSSVTDIINIDNQYKELIELFAASRCFQVDEQEYRAADNRNEFESRLLDMSNDIKESDAYAAKLTATSGYKNEQVTNVYFNPIDDDSDDELDSSTL